jgi:hypothetical protein
MRRSCWTTALLTIVCSAEALCSKTASGKPNLKSKARAVTLPTPGVRLKRSQAFRLSLDETIFFLNITPQIGGGRFWVRFVTWARLLQIGENRGIAE